MMSISSILVFLLFFFLFVCCSVSKCHSKHKTPSLPSSLSSHLTSVVKSNIQFLSDDLLAGRAPGTDGETIAAKYIQAQMSSLGLTAGGELEQSSGSSTHSFLQTVPLRGQSVTTAAPLFFSSAQSQLEMDWLVDFVGTTDVDIAQNEQQVVTLVNNTKVIFVGFGIDSTPAGYKWNDFQGIDVTDSVLLILLGQPDYFANVSNPTPTYYARWTYKYEECRRQRARACILLHTDESAGYDWSVVLSSNSGEQIRSDAPLENPLVLRAWIPHTRANDLIQSYDSDQSFDLWAEKANQFGFQPIVLNGFTAGNVLSYQSRLFQGHNVIGAILGDKNGTVASKENIVCIGHLDHLGVRNGNIYDGALDNASGASMVLASAQLILYWIAKALHHDYWPLRRNIIFLSPTAEEAGLIGSAYYAATSASGSSSVLPVGNSVAAFAYDIGNAWGATSDFVALGAEKSTLGDLLKKVGGEQMNLSLTVDPTPNQLLFFRSDHFSYAKRGVPAVWLQVGTQFVGEDSSYWQRVVQDGYMAKQYHQPSDKYNASWDLSGMIQQIELTTRTIWQLAIDDQITPKCTPSCA